MTVHPILADDLTALRHGFFTRDGGVSTGIYQGLNCGAGSDDAAQNVAENRTRVAAHMGVTPQNLVSVHQCHSATAIYVDQPFDTPRPKCDAMVTDQPGLALGILTADCAPVLFADPDAGVVGAAHSGWKGAIGGVLQATLDLMEQRGATRANIRAVVGPTISQRAYEVGPEFLEQFLDEDPEFARFFAAGTNDRAQFDLPGFVLSQLRAAGCEQASWTGHCTYCDQAKFYSYRHTTHQKEPDYGRLISVIRAGKTQ